MISTSTPHRVARLTTLAIAVLLGACGAEDDTADQPGTTAPTTTTPPTTVPPTTVPPTTGPAPGRFETITSVIDDGAGPSLCFTVLDSLPPQCGLGIALDGWSWDDIDVEMSQSGTTWVDQIYVLGTYDEGSDRFAVDQVRLPSDDDRERLLLDRPMPDFSTPCPEPATGWPVPALDEWPAAQVEALPGYAGSWVAEGPGVMTVKFTGDVAAAEAAVRELYDGALCVVPATHTFAELQAVQQRLAAMTDHHVVSSAVYVDRTGEWVEVNIVPPDADLQQSLDAELGDGTVRFGSPLRAVA